MLNLHVLKEGSLWLVKNCDLHNLPLGPVKFNFLGFVEPHNGWLVY